MNATETETPVTVKPLHRFVAAVLVVFAASLVLVGVVLLLQGDPRDQYHPADKVDIGTAVTEYPPTPVDACRWLKREADNGVPAADRWGHYVTGTGNYAGTDSMLAAVLSTCPEALQ